MDMQMTFYWGYNATILFPWWHCSTALEFYVSCFCIFALCLSSSKLKAICQEIQQKTKCNHPVVLTNCPISTVCTAAGSAPGIPSAESPVATQTERCRCGPLLQPHISHSHYNMELASWVQVSEQDQQGTTQEHQLFRKAGPFVVWLLLLLSVMIDWGMMLVCMTFNGGLFLSVVVGVATGQLVFQRRTTGGTDCCSVSIHG